MNRQETFDTALNHLRIQGKPAMGSGPTCMYRGPDNTKCAVGALIPDHLYNPDMEGMTADELVLKYPELAKFLSVEGVWREPTSDARFLLALQRDVHDNPAHITRHISEQFMKEVERGARLFAFKFSLVYKEPKS